LYHWSNKIIIYKLNKSATVLECFLSGVSKFGLPHRVTSDKGLENTAVADFSTFFQCVDYVPSFLIMLTFPGPLAEIIKSATAVFSRPLSDVTLWGSPNLETPDRKHWHKWWCPFSWSWKNREGISFWWWKHGNATTETKGIPCTVYRMVWP
jgi:hypothetical protein